MLMGLLLVEVVALYLLQLRHSNPNVRFRLPELSIGLAPVQFFSILSKLTSMQLKRWLSGQAITLPEALSQGVVHEVDVKII